jgi:hypothetical protein
VRNERYRQEQYGEDEDAQGIGDSDGWKRASEDAYGVDELGSPLGRGSRRRAGVCQEVSGDSSLTCRLTERAEAHRSAGPFVLGGISVTDGGTSEQDLPHVVSAAGGVAQVRRRNNAECRIRDEACQEEQDQCQYGGRSDG